MNGARFAPYNVAMLRGARALPGVLAALTNAAVELTGGGQILNGTELETSAPCEVLIAYRFTRPDVATAAAVIKAVRWALSTIFVERVCPLKRSLVPAAKFVPVTLTVKSALPALMLPGATDVMEGCRVVAASGTKISHMLRPWVPARRVRAFRCKTRHVTPTPGKPFPQV